MRARCIAVVVLALTYGCSSDEPASIVEVLPERPAPEPNDRPQGGDTLEQRLDAVDAPPTVEAPCRQLAVLEVQVREMRQRYTEQHPEVRRVRQRIAQLRDEVPTDEVCSSTPTQ